MSETGLTAAYGTYREELLALRHLPWRQGGKQPQNVYLVLGGDWETDHEIAVFKTPELAEDAVKAHNATRLTLLL